MTMEQNRQAIAFAVILCALVLFILLLILEVPTGIKDPLMIAFGMFITKFGTVVDYFFGSSERSSEGSKEKTKMLKGD